MNDLIPRACCHISDKNGRNEKQERNRSCFSSLFTFVTQLEFAQVLCKLEGRSVARLQP